MSQLRKPDDTTSIDDDLRAIAYKMADKGIRRVELTMFENQKVTIMLAKDAVSQLVDDLAEVWRIRR
ncbi:hypothetical protein [cf. Phormidesmis sp. LEGE 11477]|uniref:hypothetical protein n=1 Tax=cf. Phormidesmis sp. LEGE 11477 TaxID=1828680 RepID=UPI00187F5AC4|nr:hypothetical protein [cf. Phormidesmis sp. LEGE 11477]MBE9064373.1 hypothetical protein [cf. Phormidesmis sp. LEGE 11477]